MDAGVNFQKKHENRAIIIVAAHKQADMPNFSCYLPVQVGREGKNEIGYVGDDTGDNISIKNMMYCELTGLYWAWKNLDCQWLGLAHYRRHFSTKKRLLKKGQKLIDYVLSDDELHSLITTYAIIVPIKRKYYVERIESHYKNTIKEGEKHLAATRKIIAQKYPAYVAAFDLVMQKTSAHMFNMFIMRRDLADQYCEWLFSILFALEKEIDTTGYSHYDLRYLGRVSELLLDVWLLKGEYVYKEIAHIDLWSVNWPKKIAMFLMAKLFKKKYRRSL